MSTVGNTVTFWLQIAALTPITAFVIADHGDDVYDLLLAPYVDEYEVWQDRDVRVAVERSDTPADGTYTIPDPLDGV